MRSRKIALAALAGLAMSGSAAAGSGAALAIIDVLKTESGIEIVGKALAMSDAHISGEMVISRKGASGSVSTRQGSDFDLTSGQSVDIARVGVSYVGGDLLEITLTLRQDGVVIAESVLTTTGN